MKLLKCKTRVTSQENYSTNWKKMSCISLLQLISKLIKARKLNNRFCLSKARFLWKTSFYQLRSKGKIISEYQRLPFTLMTVPSKSERKWLESAKKRNCSLQVRQRTLHPLWVMKWERRFSLQYFSCSKLFNFCAVAPSCLRIGWHRCKRMPNWWWVN